LVEHRARSRSIGARLDDHSIASGKGAGERLER